MKTFEYYFIERNGLWSERLQEVKDKGFDSASPIARLIYECERGNINQHASEDLKAISAKLQVLEDMESVNIGFYIDTSVGKLPFYKTAEKCQHETSIHLENLDGIDIHRCTWVCGEIYCTVTEGITTREITNDEALFRMREMDKARMQAHQAGDGLA